ncbi:MFS transporter [Candidatus Bathyarchaeota archaeon]|nr:MFS transporter [Candidatus Bathyarchaeota archaeon]
MTIAIDERVRLLRVLYATIFLTSTGFGTATFLTPVYASGLGADYVSLGLIGAARNLVYTVGTLTVGYLLDRFERVKIYMVFMTIGAVVVALLGAVENVTYLILLNSLVGLFSASFWVTASTLTVDISPSEILTKSISYYNLSWILGFTVGPYFGGLISDAFGFKALFIILSALIISSVALSSIRIRPIIQLRSRGSTNIANLGSLKGLALAYIILIPFTILLGIYMAIVPGYLKIVGFSSALVGLLLTVTNGFRGLAFYNSEWFVSKGIRRSVTMASLLFFTGMTMFSVAKSTLEYAIPLIMYGVASGIMTPLMLDYIAKRCEKSALGTAMGVHEGVYGLGMLIGPMAGGSIAESYGPSTLYQLLAAIALTMPFIAWILGKNEMPISS